MGLSLRAFVALEDVDRVEADFFDGITAFHDEQCGQLERTDSCTVARKVVTAEFKERDRIVLKSINAKRYN